MNTVTRGLERLVSVEVGHGDMIRGDLYIPEKPAGLIIFAHGSGSSRFSSRNRYVAAVLHNEGFATLLLDLLTPPEEHIDEVTRELRFDTGLLAGRLVKAIDWSSRDLDLVDLPIGLFGASTGAAAALIAAARRPDKVAGVVSRGGRPDLAAMSLRQVRSPTLLIVGGDDGIVIELNREAMLQLSCPKLLRIIPHASHLFEEPGALEQVADAAAKWFGELMQGSTTHRQEVEV